MRIAELGGRRVAIWGLGREGRAALTALRTHVTDLAPTLFCSDSEARVLATEEFLRIDSRPPDAAMLRAFDVVIKSPGISAYRPEIELARSAGTQFTSGTELWFAEHPHARVIAVTGTKGKSTVSASIAHLLRSLGRRVALAGNIGVPLLELLDPPRLPDWWVVELSSFQTREAGAVEIGVINNVHEEHLDWHGSRERYVDDKLALADAARTLIVNALQAELLARTTTHPHRILFGDRAGWHVADDMLMKGDAQVLALDVLRLPGAHNALNLCAALTVLDAAGEDAVRAAAAIATFEPLPHRLQPLGERDGLEWIDDSIATTPQATLQALASLSDRAVTLLIGGYERGLDWQPFAQAVQRTPPHTIITMGANRERIGDVLRECAGAYHLQSAATLAEAVALSRAATPARGVVLLSPGAPSFDQFRDYAERGQAFARLAGFNAPTTAVIAGLGIA